MKFQISYKQGSHLLLLKVFTSILGALCLAGAAKHYTMYRTAPTTNNYLVSTVNVSRLRSPSLEPNKHMPSEDKSAKKIFLFILLNI